MSSVLDFDISAPAFKRQINANKCLAVPTKTLIEGNSNNLLTVSTSSKHLPHPLPSNTGRSC